MADTRSAKSVNALEAGLASADSEDQDSAGPRASYRLAPQPVLMVAEARANFSRLLSDVDAGPENSVLVGPRGKPSMACVSYTRFAPILKHGNKAEKLAFLVVEELLPDAPLHLRVPAVRELSVLPMEDLELLLRIDVLPLRDAEMKALQQRMRHPEALERLTKRANLAKTIADARESGFYDVIEDASSEVVDREGASR
ncbi:MAG: hypothetical protein Q7V14_02695 [Coriobacteriia bacterium]|nr:hypothetical protein [Coriobacteriia bacterium]MDO9108866.1 hypothetical protein [Coriobacteriia bacterium]